jgi:hypothetical protein
LFVYADALALEDLVVRAGRREQPVLEFDKLDVRPRLRLKDRRGLALCRHVWFFTPAVG